jgi:hypothetical protein
VYSNSSWSRIENICPQFDVLGIQPDLSLRPSQICSQKYKMTSSDNLILIFTETFERFADVLNSTLSSFALLNWYCA